MTIYYNQRRPEVTKELHHPEPIRVTFSDVTLALSAVEASWLAANIQRELRQLESEEIASAIHLTVEQKRQLRVGDRVTVRLDPHYHRPPGDDIFEVIREPWQLGNGAWVIGLNGISGWYDLSRVTGIISTVHSRGDAVHGR